MKWEIGDISVTLVKETEIQVGHDFQGMLPDADPAVLEANADWLKPHFIDDDWNMKVSVHAYVLETQDKTIIVDTCMGNDRVLPGYEDMSNLQTSFLSDLNDAGYPPESVDLVVCTHLHFDHVGWNSRFVDSKWVPTFPNAKYLFGRMDYESCVAGDQGAAITFDDAVKLVFDAGLAELVDTDQRITSEIRLEPTPGHSPGHMSVRISSNGEEAVITGDVLHHPVQFVAPEWQMIADSDPEQAVETRKDFRSRYGDQPVLIFGTHFGPPYAGHLVSDGHRWKFLT
ncbi:MAG: MBL fold metallo-hydrolase [Deltaproteobacteria bacterium]|nr:MBL fold metallo-hydrolase [Deltaproteobacteria bacterium]